MIETRDTGGAPTGKKGLFQAVSRTMAEAMILVSCCGVVSRECPADQVRSEKIQREIRNVLFCIFDLVGPAGLEPATKGL